MEINELIHKVQLLANSAGLAYNTQEEATAVLKLRELRDLLIDEVIGPDETPVRLAAEVEETETPVQAEAVDEEPEDPGPEAEPSEQ